MSPSFCVTPARQTYYCFGCNAGGDVISFVQNYDNINFSEALSELARQAGIELPRQEMSLDEKRRQARRERMLAMNGEAALYYYYQLRSPA